MDGSQNVSGGFSPGVQEQLRQASMSMLERGRGRGQDNRGRGRGNFQQRGQMQHRSQAWNHTNPYQHGQSHNVQTWNQPVMDNPNDQNAFPPIGAERSQVPLNTQQQYQPPQPQAAATQYHQSPPHPIPNPNQFSPAQRRDFQPRGRGSPFRGRGNQTFHRNQNQTHFKAQSSVQNTDEFHRPAPVQRRLFTPGMNPHFGNMEEQRAFQRMIMDQSDFMNYLANQSLKNQLTAEEQQAKECFRKELEAIAQKVIASAQTDDKKFNPEHVQLKLYGSLGSGFAVAGSDMDLLLAFPQTEEPLGDIEIDSRRMLEKALLDAGIGARLLTNTRVPILRVCEKPSAELLKNLRDYRTKWEENLLKEDIPIVDEGFGNLPDLTNLQELAAAEALADLTMDAHEVPLPASPVLEHANLEFIGDCGIQCDINFSNYVALHNTRLLKTYGLCDPRVRQVGVFVKNWAKARDINTPYRGTLSSYGYILMVLHYLMNVVSPPILPNLQDMAKQKDGWEGKSEIELIEGFDVRFVRDTNEVQAIMKEMPRNHESVGALLRGFFWYYADPRGFHWNHDVIAIRSRYGTLAKKTKGWTEAKWSSSNSNVRLRYLLAIEDPFELEHNVGRTVGHSGIVAIRDEFRRAWTMIEKIKYDNDARMWYWLTVDNQKVSGDEMIAVAMNRGDLLRIDQNYRREKVRKMKADLEAKEKALQNAMTQDLESAEEIETNGTCKEISDPPTQGLESFTTPSMALISNGVSQVKKRQPKQSRRRVASESEDEPHENPVIVTEEPMKATKKIDWDRPFDETEIMINEEWKSEHMNQMTGEKIVEQSAPAVVNEEPFVDTSNMEAPTEDYPDAVIAWARKSPAGRWLHWRDRQVRAGTWRGARDPMFRRLDETFPYDQNMTVAEQTHKNKILTTLYMNSFRPRKLTSASEEKLSGEVKTPSDWLAATTDNSDPNPIWEMPNAKAAGEEHHERRHDSLSSPSIKAERLQTPSVYTTEASERNMIKSSSGPPQMSEKSTKSIRKPKRPPFRKNNKKRDNTATTDVPSEPTFISTQAAPSNPIPQNTSPAPTKPRLSRASQDLLDLFTNSPPTLVPLTLFPDLPPHQRPRDEDPNIIPIPRTFHHKFDPRQLADLETIRLGGNGCARAGEEFDLEEDFEFGGWPVLEEVNVDVDSGHAEQVERWEPRGDTEDLLGELPAGGWESRSGYGA